MAHTTVINCKCNSDYQNAVYGTNKRLANIKSDKPDASVARCTVCGKEVSFKNTPKN